MMTQKPNEPRTRAEAGTREKVVRKVRLAGLTDIMFDRFVGGIATKLEPWQKLYLGGDGDRQIMLPAENIMSFLSAQNMDSAPKRLLDSRKYKAFPQACRSYVTIEPEMIPFLRDGKPIFFGKFEGDVDKLSGVCVHRSGARLKDGTLNPKVRPVLPMPWELEFELTLFPNKRIQETQLVSIFTEGLICIGLGTFRRRYGKAEIILWE